MTTTSRIYGFILALIAAPLLLAACSDDTTGPDEDNTTYPVTLKPTSIENKSEIRAFERQGNAWVEITSQNPDILTDESFAESTVIIEDEEAEFTLTSSNQWTADLLPGATLSYTRSGNEYVFPVLQDISFYATGNNSQFDVHMVAGVSMLEDGGSTVSTSTRISYDPNENPIDALVNGFAQLGDEEGTILAYQTFDIRYVAE